MFTSDNLFFLIIRLFVISPKASAISVFKIVLWISVILLKSSSDTTQHSLYKHSSAFAAPSVLCESKKLPFGTPKFHLRQRKTPPLPRKTADGRTKTAFALRSQVGSIERKNIGKWGSNTPFSALNCHYLNHFLSLFRENLSQQKKNRLRKVLYLSFLGENVMAERYNYSYYS